MRKSGSNAPSLLGYELMVLSLLVCTRMGLAQTVCPAAASTGCTDSYNVSGSTLLISGGAAVCLVCGDTGQQQAGTTWRIDHGTVPEADGSIEGDGTLVVYDPACVFTIDLPESVECTLPGPGGETHSSIVFLRVFEPPDVPDRVTVNESDTLRISCSDRDSTTGLVQSITWEDENGRVVDDDNNLVIENVTRNDTGIYTCVAVSSDLMELHSNTSVTVQYPPTVSTIIPYLRMIPEGQTLSLSCDYDGVPPPNISWSLGGDALDSTDPRVTVNSTDTQSELTLTDLGEGEEGEYSCTAVNLLGSDKTTTMVIVQVAPDPPVDLQVTALTTESLTLSWKFGHDGFSTITHTIIEYRSISPLDNDRGNRSASSQPTNLTIYDLQPNTVYEVEVYLENVVGRSDPSVINASTLYLLLEAPSITNYTTLNFTELILEWMSPDVNPLTTAPATGWIVRYKPCTANSDTMRNITDPSVNSLIISELAPGTEYCARVAGYSEVGVGAFSEYAKAATMDSVPSAPQNFTASIVSSHGVWLSWAPPQYNGGGTIVGYIAEIIREHDGQNVLFRITDASVLSLTIQNELMESETYIIDVAAVGTIGTGSKAQQTITTLSQDSPQPLLSAPCIDEVVGRTVLLSWTNPGGTIQEYIIQYKPETSDWLSEQTNEITARGSELKFTLCCLTATTPYNVRIQTVNERGPSVYSPEATFNTGVSLPLIVTGPSGSVSEGTTIFLNCTYQDGSTPLDVKWTRLNRALPSSSTVIETVLVLADVEITDGGEFICSLGAEGEEASYFLNIFSDGGASSSMTTILIGVIAPAVVVILLVIGIYSVILCIVRRRSKTTDVSAQGNSSALSFTNPDFSPSSPVRSSPPKEPRYTNSKRNKEPIYAEALEPKEKKTWPRIADELKINSDSDAGKSLSRSMHANPLYQSIPQTPEECEKGKVLSKPTHKDDEL